MAKIATKNGIYHFKPKTLFVGLKKINRSIAKQNLLDFNRIAKENNLPFGLIYGTLLGAIRENDFIEHDEDIDLYILGEYNEIILNLLFVLRNNGFEVARYDRRGLISIIRNDEYIDIYIFHKFEKGVRICCGECVLEKHIIDTTHIDFLTESFMIPRDYLGYLQFQYGSDWKVPIHYTDFKVKKSVIFLMKIKERMKYILPDSLFSLFVLGLEKKTIQSFYNKVKLNEIKL
jgi:hypothetical protein